MEQNEVLGEQRKSFRVYMEFPKKTTFMKSKKRSSREKTTSSWNNELSLGKGPSSPRENVTSFGNNELSSKKPKFPRETYVPNLFTTITISSSFLYSLVTYHWIGLEKS
jgi:hypothetical protein